jgi:diaminopimelate decarboxylase
MSRHARATTASKFGLTPAENREAIGRADRSSVLRLDGVHSHVGSQLLDVEQLAAACTVYRVTWDDLRMRDVG